MKRVAAAAVIMGLLAMPALAQHGGAQVGGGGHVTSGSSASHGGEFAGHGGFGGGFSAPRMGGFTSHGPAQRFGGFAPRNGSFRTGGFAPNGWMGSGRTRFTPRSGAGVNRFPYRRFGDFHPGKGSNGHGGNHYGGDRSGRGHDRDEHFHHRRPFYNEFNGLPYAYGYYPYWHGFVIAPGALGPDWLDSDDWDESAQNETGGYASAPYPDYGQPAPDYSAPAPQNYGPPPAYPQPDSGTYQPRPAYQPQAAPSASPRQPYTGGSAAPAPQQALTVIFKDGRAPETIHNYMLTASTLTVLDAKYQQIPVSQIDIAATEAANRADGVNFQVPRN